MTRRDTRTTTLHDAGRHLEIHGPHHDYRESPDVVPCQMVQPSPIPPGTPSADPFDMRKRARADERPLRDERRSA